MPPDILYTGKLIFPSCCVGLSATRNNNPVFPFHLNTPGFSKHTISMPSIPAFRSEGLSNGFSLKRCAMSIVLYFWFAQIKRLNGKQKVHSACKGVY